MCKRETEILDKLIERESAKERERDKNKRELTDIIREGIANGVHVSVSNLLSACVSIRQHT